MKPSPRRLLLRPPSLRGQLLVGILLPVLGFVVLNAASLYAQALQAADTAYDRTLLASAKAIGERLEVGTDGGAPRLQATLEYSALEAFEADNRSRLFYKVSGFGGEVVSGFEDLAPPRAGRDEPNPYAALVRFYDDEYRGEPVRMAVLLQPVAGPAGQGMATVQVAETLELRRTLARALLLQTLWQQALLVALIAFVVVAVVQRATRPVRALSQTLRELTRNLLHNAIRHSPRGGRLAVHVEAVSDEARLHIEDNGPGIAAAQREHLFQPFAGSLPDATGHEGSGLGLAICREIVTALGGRIDLDNRLQDGRTVGLDACVALPRIKA